MAFFEGDDSASSRYNLGNTLAKQNRFADAVSAYQEAISLDPGLESARHNKRLIELYLEQQAESRGSQSGDVDGDESSTEFSNPSDTETRIGAGETSLNPAENPQLGPGLGASGQPGQVDPFERFDAQEEALQRFVLRAQEGDQMPDQELIERWIKSLPETSTDLFRRIFMRDAQRQKRQPR